MTILLPSEALGQDSGQGPGGLLSPLSWCLKWESSACFLLPSLGPEWCYP